MPLPVLRMIWMRNGSISIKMERPENDAPQGMLLTEWCQQRPANMS